MYVFMLPGYDQGPVVHDRDGYDEEPVVVCVSCRINHCDLFSSAHTYNELIKIMDHGSWIVVIHISRLNSRLLFGLLLFFQFFFLFLFFLLFLLFLLGT